MSMRRTMVTLTALASMALVGGGIGALRHAGSADVTARATTTTTLVPAATDRALPAPVRVESATANRELSALDQLAAAQHQVAWLELAIATVTCERDLLRAERDAMRSSDAQDAVKPPTCNRP